MFPPFLLFTPNPHKQTKGVEAAFLVCQWGSGKRRMRRAKVKRTYAKARTSRTSKFSKVKAGASCLQCPSGSWVRENARGMLCRSKRSARMKDKEGEVEVEGGRGNEGHEVAGIGGAEPALPTFANIRKKRICYTWAAKMWCHKGGGIDRCQGKTGMTQQAT